MSEARLKHFGWGRVGETLSPAEEDFALSRYRQSFGVDAFEERTPPSLDQITLRAPRIAPPPALAAICTTDRFDRAQHTYGKSFLDYVRGLAGDYANAPDLVAYPRDEWTRSLSRIAELDSLSGEARSLQRVVYANAVEGDLDKQGRIVIPSALKEYAGLDRDVVVAGVNDHLEIWDRAAWRGELAESEGRTRDVAERLAAQRD